MTSIKISSLWQTIILGFLSTVVTFGIIVLIEQSVPTEFKDFATRIIISLIVGFFVSIFFFGIQTKLEFINYVKSNDSTFNKLLDHAECVDFHKSLSGKFGYFLKFINVFNSFALEKIGDDKMIISLNVVGVNDYLKTIKNVVDVSDRKSYISIFTDPFYPDYFYTGDCGSKKTTLEFVRKLTENIPRKNKHRLLIYKDQKLMKSLNDTSDVNLNDFWKKINDANIYWYKSSNDEETSYYDSTLIDNTIIVKRITDKKVEIIRKGEIHLDENTVTIITLFSNALDKNGEMNGSDEFISIRSINQLKKEITKKINHNINKNERDKKDTVN